MWQTNFDLKLDTWWKVVLWLGVFGVISSFVFTPEFIQPKHLFGFSMGMLIIGLTYFAAQRWYIKPPNVYTGGVAQYSITEHTACTRMFLIIGWLLVFIFGFLILKNLIL
jgi:hypothetical protein